MIYIIIAVGLVIFDQLIKFLSVLFLQPIGRIEILPNIFNLEYIQNTGAAWGMFDQFTWVLTIISAVAVIVMIYLFKKDYIKNKFGKFALMLVISGAVGNLIDRAFLGYVIDMFSVDFLNFICNIADIYITIGGAMICYYIIFMHEESESKGIKNDN